jgi:hypothetical protein
MQRLLLLLACALSIVPFSAAAAPINPIAPGSLTVAGVIDFLIGPAASYDSILALPGASFSEHFAGQTVSASGDYDVVSGMPTGPLALVTGPVGQNLGAGETTFPILSSIAGLGPAGNPNANAVGRGALSILFDLDQSAVGFEIGLTSVGSVTAQWFRRDGTLIDTTVISGFTDTIFPPTFTAYAFEREGAVADIAGITFTTSGTGLMNFDTFRFTPVPEPSSMMLLFGGIGLTAWGRRRGEHGG